MKLMACPCGQSFTLTTMPHRPFVACPRCGRRLPVHCELNEFMDRCPKCGRFLERGALSIHSMGCMGDAETGPETRRWQHV